MKKSLMALAVAGALAPAVAMADASTVTLYGTLNIDFEYVKADGAAEGGTNLPGRQRVSSNSSNIGFRGIEPLTKGLNAIFQVESSVALDTGTGSTLAGRNSNVGLSGGFGTVFLGQWDTPYKVSTGRLDPFGDTTIAGYTNTLGGNGSVTAANDAATRNAFDRRQRNSVQYWSPNWVGFSFRVGASANEEKTSTPAFSANPRLYSLSAAYENGPIYVTGAWERHEEYDNTPTIKTEDTGWKLGAGYTFLGNHTIGLIFERLKFEGNIAEPVASKAEVDTWFLSYLGRFGPHTARAAYGQSRDIKLDGRGENDTGVRHWSLGYGYSLSKRTEVYALYARIDNESNAANDFAINPIVGVNPGADPQGFGVGIRHTF